MSEGAEKVQTFCEVAGCSGAAVTEVWSVDDNRHLQVCWKHDDNKTGESSGDSD